MIRLLEIQTLRLSEFDEDDVPPYAIASHRWQDNESTLADMLEGRRQDTEGFTKIRGFCSFIQMGNEKGFFDGAAIKWLWIDTCCIDKKSSAELYEAINSMYNWYAEAEICLAYLFDVRRGEDSNQFETSEWFKRGWTLQELIAPRIVLFLDKEWEIIGHKDGTALDDPQDLNAFGMRLNARISQQTGIHEPVLNDFTEVDKLSIEARLAWIDGRLTTKIEDRAYCLLGIFNVYMPLVYGERQQAMRRLFEEILRRQTWMLSSFNADSGLEDGTMGNIEESSKTLRDNILHNIKTLRDKVMEIETESSSSQPNRQARESRRLKRAVNTMWREYIYLEQQTMMENVELQKARAFWNPLEQLSRDATS